MKKECNIFILPTTEKEVCKGQLVLGAGNYLFVSKAGNIGSLTAQHLYITSNEEVKKGDWIFHKLDEKPLKVTNEPQYLDKSKLSEYGYKKIIASTNSSLSLPQPSQTFIEKYASEYNTGNVIDEVIVEYKTDYDWSLGEDSINFPLGEILKVNLKDNTIPSVKYSWNREEVIELLKICIINKTGSLSPIDEQWINDTIINYSVGFIKIV